MKSESNLYYFLRLCSLSSLARPCDLVHSFWCWRALCPPPSGKPQNVEIKSLHNKYMFKEGESFSLTCTAEGYPKPHLTLEFTNLISPAKVGLKHRHTQRERERERERESERDRERACVCTWNLLCMNTWACFLQASGFHNQLKKDSNMGDTDKTNMVERNAHWMGIAEEPGKYRWVGRSLLILV